MLSIWKNVHGIEKIAYFQERFTKRSCKKFKNWIRFKNLRFFYEFDYFYFLKVYAFEKIEIRERKKEKTPKIKENQTRFKKAKEPGLNVHKVIFAEKERKWAQ